jgi:uncharacterized protein (DUF433 family)
VSYGAAEFSRDLDLVIVASLRSIAALRKALVDLHAEVIAVPPFDLKYLRKGHAVHFRCHHPEVEGLRVDVMSRMRGVDSFERLWSRRTTIELPGGAAFDLLSLPDLVQARKTQRDKDWPMKLQDREWAKPKLGGQVSIRRCLTWRRLGSAGASASRLVRLALASAQGMLARIAPVARYDMTIREIVHSDPEIMGGTPVFVGTRVPVRILLDYLEGGDPLEEFLENYPSVSREHAVAFIEEAGKAALAQIA